VVSRSVEARAGGGGAARGRWGARDAGWAGDRYYDNWLKMGGVRKLVAAGLEWSREVDATSYVDGKRSTLNGTGVAEEGAVWDKYNAGCSVRLLRPQRRMDGMARLLSLLEEHWGSSAGANVYLTPAGHQGFAPHWDDIEAFILQTEGAKRWRVYAPRSEDETMPRYSSGNLEQVFCMSRRARAVARCVT